MELYDEAEQLIQMHPALDIVNNVAYVAVRVRGADRQLIDAIITSERKMFSPNEWTNETYKRGLIPYTEVHIDCGARWNNKSMREFLNSELVAPNWQETYKAIYQAFDERLVVSDQRYLAVLVLYAMMTYFQPLFDFLPILHMRGPAESGKSRAGNVLAGVAFNGKMDGYTTPAVVFRRAHEARYTQIISETDHLAQIGSGDGFVRQLQSGCTKGEATVEVAESGKTNKSYTPASYRIFNPRVLLSTQRFKSHPLRSRCIRLDLIKDANADKQKLSRSVVDDKVWSPQRDKLYSLLLLQWKDVERMRDRLLGEWSVIPAGRTFDKWLPLATMAALVSPDVLEIVEELALESLGEQQEDAENVFDAHIMKFAAWVVRSKSQALSRKQLYDMFLRPQQSDEYTTPDQPEWAESTGDIATISFLKQSVRSDRQLITELKRLHLIPQQSKHTRQGDVYELDQERIMNKVKPHIGDAFLADSFAF